MRSISTRALAATACAALLVPVVADAASRDGAYKGKTENNGTVNVTIKGGKVTRFSANVLVFCTGGGGYEQRVVYVTKKLQLSKAGSFTYEGEDRDGTDVAFTGKLKGKKITGRVEVHYAQGLAPDIQFCNADKTYSAKRR